MIDFRSIGTQQGFGDAIRMQARSADEAMERANEIIAAKNDTIAELRAELAQAQAALAVETAHSAGLLAQARTLKVDFLKAITGSALFRETGKKFKGGKVQTAFDVVYEKAFDAKAAEMGIKNVTGLREKAI